MDFKVRRLNQELKFFDRELFALRENTGRITINRRHRTRDENGVALIQPLQVLALTDNWTNSGTPVDWGIEPVMTRLRSMDGWNRDRFYEEEIAKPREKAEESRKRAQRGNLQDAAAEMRRPFAKVWDTYNVSSLIKKER